MAACGWPTTVFCTVRDVRGQLAIPQTGGHTGGQTGAPRVGAWLAGANHPHGGRGPCGVAREAGFAVACSGPPDALWAFRALDGRPQIGHCRRPKTFGCRNIGPDFRAQARIWLTWAGLLYSAFHIFFWGFWALFPRAPNREVLPLPLLHPLMDSWDFWRPRHRQFL